MPRAVLAGKTAMYVRLTASGFQFSSNAREVAFSIAKDSFADISYACGSMGGDYVVLTAVEDQRGVADVRRNFRGAYRAFQISSAGIRQLTDEYTNTAIALPRGGLAYSNGSSLVIERNGARELYKVSRFSWGPASLACNADETLIGMTRWKGDDRKLAWIHQGTGALHISRFSYYSYVFCGPLIYYTLGSSVSVFDPATGKSSAATTRKINERLRERTRITRTLDRTTWEYSNLSMLGGKILAAVSVRDADNFERLYHAVVEYDPHAQAIGIVQEIDPPWTVAGIQSDGSTLELCLQRHEELRLAETRKAALGKDVHFLAAGWSLLDHPCYPNFGFQFFPAAPTT